MGVPVAGDGRQVFRVLVQRHYAPVHGRAFPDRHKELGRGHLEHPGRDRSHHGSVLMGLGKSNRTISVVSIGATILRL